MAKRREQLAELLEDKDYQPGALLDSLVAAMSEDEWRNLMTFIMRTEDWRYRMAANGEIILHELIGEFETGASNRDTNDFILTSASTKSIHDEILTGTTAHDIASSYSGEFFCNLDKVSFIEAETYFERVIR